MDGKYHGARGVDAFMKLKLVAKEKLAGDVVSFMFDAPAGFRWKAGQYMHVVLPHDHADSRGEERWFTIAAAPFEGRPRITTRIIGEGESSFKKALAALEPGSRLEVKTPEGDFTLEDPDAEYVFIAGGIGFTPFHAILTELAHQGSMPKITVLYGARSKKPVYYDELQGLQERYSQLQVHYIIEPERISEAVIRRYVPMLTDPYFYVSGPEPMVEAFDDMLREMGTPEAHIKQDYFPGYTWQL